MDADRREQHSRRAGDIELAELSQAFGTLSEDVREMKELLAENYVPRITDLETWRTTVAATELERERNRRVQTENAISKRSFWFGLAGLALTMVATASGLAALVISHT